MGDGRNPENRLATNFLYLKGQLSRPNLAMGIDNDEDPCLVKITPTKKVENVLAACWEVIWSV